MNNNLEWDLLDLAQMAGEERLILAEDLAVYDEEYGHSDEEREPTHPGYQILADPFCGCHTCVVREVIDAAFPFLKTFVLLQAGYEPKQV